MTDRQFRPTPLSMVPEEVQVSSMRQQYANWISESLASEFGPEGKQQNVLMFFGNVITYEKNQWGGVEDLISNAYGMYIPEEDQASFRGAVADVVAQRFAQPDIDPDEAKVLIMTIDDLMIPEAAAPLADALMTNKSIRENEEVLSRVYESIIWLAEQRHIEDSMGIAKTTLERVMDFEGFDERWLIHGIDAFLGHYPLEAERVVMKYADRIKAVKQKVQEDGGQGEENYNFMVDGMLNPEFHEVLPQLSPASLAVLKI